MPCPSGSPPWIMKPEMIRWKIVPLYSGSVVFWRVSGRVHSRTPPARSAKIATVFGAGSRAGRPQDGGEYSRRFGDPVPGEVTRPVVASDTTRLATVAGDHPGLRC